MARRSAAVSAFGGTPRVSCQANVISSSMIRMASGEVCCRTAASAIAQGGAAARPRAQLLTWRGVCVAGEACEGGLADVGAGEQGGELGVQERSHGAVRIEFTSRLRPETPSGTRSMRDNPAYRAWQNFE